MEQERWETIPEFPSYEISNYGNVYNSRLKQDMSTSVTNHGHAKITLRAEDGTRHTRSVGLLVAQAFVQPPNDMCDQIIFLDGNLSNVVAHNLAWRPRWFAWQYTRQLKIPPRLHFTNLPVYDVAYGVEYESIVEAGMTAGLLFEQIWRSTYTGHTVYPTDSIFEVVERV